MSRVRAAWAGVTSTPQRAASTMVVALAAVLGGVGLAVAVTGLPATEGSAALTSPMPSASSQRPHTAASPTTTPASRQTAAPTPPVSPLGSPSYTTTPLWARTTVPGEGIGWDTVAAVVHGRERYLALGWHYEPNPHIGYNGGPRLWASWDGVTWESIRVPTEFDGTLGSYVSLVVTPSGEFLLFGNSYDAANVLRPLVMSSADGATWQAERVDLPSQLSLTRVVRGPNGYLLAGRDDGRGGLWLSPDGLAWRSVHTLTQSDSTYEVITDIAAGDDGFVAVGATGVLGTGDSTFFALASGNGSTWFQSESQFPTDEGHAGIALVAPIGGDWVATTGWTRTATRFWRSSDGLRWEQAGIIEQAPAGHPVLVPAGGQLFYSAWDVPVGKPGGWTSIDGISWTSLELGPDGVLVGAFHDDRGLLLLGSTVLNEDRADATFWRP